MRLSIVGACYLASVVANCLTGVPFGISAMFSLANCVGALVGARLLRGKIGSDVALAKVSEVTSLLVFGTVAVYLQEVSPKYHDWQHFKIRNSS